MSDTPGPQPLDRQRVLDLYRRHLGRGRARLGEFLNAPVEIASAGSRIMTSDGRSLIDCGGYAVFLIGHGHPTVVAAVIEQIRRHALCSKVLLEPMVAAAAASLASAAPPGLDHVQFVNSGAEATELGLKLARAHGKTRLIAMSGGYHGKTLGALSVTSNARYQDPFRPLLAASAVEYGKADALEAALGRAHGDACVILEPVQGEGGVIIPPPGYLARVEGLCRDHQAFLIVDEIQTGLGRCGRWWASESEISLADVVLVGKALSGGVMPVAAAVCTGEAYAPVGNDPVLHTSTFGGSPVAAAAVIATLSVIRDEYIVERACNIGQVLLDGLRDRLLPHAGGLVRDVRGKGLLIGIELARPDLVAELLTELLDRGVIANHSLNDHAVLRLTPPAILTDGDLSEVLDAVSGAVRTLVASAA